MSVKVVVDKSAWTKLKKSFLQAENLENQVGWFEEHQYGSDNDNLPMAQVAQWIEEGVRSKNIPERAFMRVGFETRLKGGENRESFRRMVAAVANGQDVFRAFHREGDSFRQTLRQTMIDWDTPPNSPVTVELKGFDDPLIESSELISNVSSKTVRGS
ncbi:MAG: hypothetical protein ACRC6V_01695 [Bacteroidales bacterium]